MVGGGNEVPEEPNGFRLPHVYHEPAKATTPAKKVKKAVASPAAKVVAKKVEKKATPVAKKSPAPKAAAKPASKPAVKAAAKKPAPKKAAKESSDSEDEDESESEEEAPAKPAPAKAPVAAAAAKKADDDTNSEEESSEEESSEEEAKPAAAAVNGAKPMEEDSDDDDDSEEDSDEDDKKPEAAAKKPPAKAEESDDEDDSEDEDESDDEDDEKEKAAAAKKAPAAAAKKDDDDDEDEDDDEESDEEDDDEEEKPAKKVKAETPVKAAAPAAAPTTPSTPGEEEITTLFVKNLPFSADQDTIAEFFADCGEVSDVRIAMDKETGRARGFCHVEFATGDAAKKALEKSGQELMGRALFCDLAGGSGGPGGARGGRTPQSGGGRFGGRGGGAGGFGGGGGFERAPRDDSNTVFVKNFDRYQDEDTLSEVFGDCGNVVGVRIPTDRETEAVAKAGELNGTDCGGRSLVVDSSAGGGGGGGGRGGGDRGGFRGRGDRGGGFRGGRGGDRGGFRGRGGDRGAEAEAAGAPGTRSVSRAQAIDSLVVSSYSARSIAQLQTLIRASTASLQLALQRVPSVVPFCRQPLTEAIRRSKLVSDQLSRRAIVMARKEVAQVARAVANCQSRLGVTMRNKKSTSTSEREAYTVGFRELENTMIRLSGVGTVLQKQIAADTQSGKLTVTAVGSMSDRTVDLFPDYGADLMRQLPGSVTTLTFNGTLGARIHSAFTYPSGVFTAKLMCAKGDTRGLDTTFYVSHDANTAPLVWPRTAHTGCLHTSCSVVDPTPTPWSILLSCFCHHPTSRLAVCFPGHFRPIQLSSIEGGPGTDSILMSIFGNDRTRVRCMTLVDGESGLTHEVEVGNDCAAGYHTISIMWSGRLIVWKYDDLILRVSSRNMLSPFPVSTTMYLYASIYDTAKYSYAWQAGYLTNADAPYVVSYKDTSAVVPAPSYNFGLPLDLTNGASVPGSAIGRGPLWPVAIDYCSDHVVTLKGYQSITFDDKGCGGRFHSTVRHYSGVFTAFVQCPAGNTSGLVSAFYLSSEEGNKEQDEIDFEWLGKDKTAVQTNFYVNGKGGREVLVPLGFDCSKGFHNYTLLWATDRLQWFIDNKMVRDVQRVQADAWPVKPMFAYASMWNASSISNGWWSGTWSGKDIPYVIKPTFSVMLFNLGNFNLYPFNSPSRPRVEPPLVQLQPARAVRALRPSASVVASRRLYLNSEGLQQITTTQHVQRPSIRGLIISSLTIEGSQGASTCQQTLFIEDSLKSQDSSFP
ncbi:unnamed protein product [Closterium sp. NIES-54]